MSATEPITQLRYDDAWNNETQLTYARDGVTIQRGRKSEGSETDPGQLDLTLNNRDGRFSPRNPLSPLFGKIGRNTPIRVRVPSTEAGVEFRNAQSGDPTDVDGWMQRAGAAITGDIDIRIDMTRESWSTPFAEVLASKWVETGNDRSWVLTLQGPSFLSLRWSEDGVNTLLSSSSVLPALTGRNTIRVTMDVDNGAGQRVIRFEYGPTLDGPWTLIVANTEAGATSIHGGGTANLAIGSTASTNGSAIFAGTNGLRGIVHGFRLYDDVTLVADPELDAVEPDAAAGDPIPDAVSGNWLRITPSWTTFRTPPAIPDPYRPDIRSVAEVVSWPQRWDTSGRDVYVPLTGAGIMRRLGAPGRAAADAVYRHVLLPQTRATSDLLGYWPLSDPVGSSRGASASGGNPMLFSTRFQAPQWGRGDLAHWLPPSILTGEDAGLINGRAAASISGGWAIDVMYRAPDPSTWGDNLPLIWWAGMEDLGGIFWRALLQPSGSLLQMQVIEANSGLSIDSASADSGDLLDGNPHHIRIWAVEAAGNDTDIFVLVDGVTAITMTVDIGTDTTPAPRIAQIGWSPQGGGTNQILPVNAGQMILWGNLPPATDIMTDAYFGWDGEDAATRFARLSFEEEIPFTLRAARSEAAQTPPMGPQRIATPLQNMQDAADVDGGILAELRDEVGLDFWPLFTLRNRAADLSLDYAAGQASPPFQPSEDDQGLTNDVTARQVGSDEQARVAVESGPLSIQPPPDGVGPYASSPQVNVHSPDQLLGQAGWRAHLATWDEARYSSLVIDLRRADEVLGLPQLREAALALDSARRVDVTGLPSHQPPDDARLLLQGYTETIRSESHQIAFNASPYGPYDVFVLDDPILGRLDTAGSELAFAVTAAATSLLVATDEGKQRWVTPADVAGQFPFNARLGGEVVRVTDISGTVSPQTFTVVRGVNGITRDWPAGTRIRLARSAVGL